MARAERERMHIFKRAAQLRTPDLAEERRDTWLTLAFHADHRQVYDAIPKRGATADFVVGRVRSPDRGCLGSRHALSVLREAVRGAAGDERQAEFQSLIDELDAPCRRAAATASSAALPARDAHPVLPGPPHGRRGVAARAPHGGKRRGRPAAGGTFASGTACRADQGLRRGRQ